MNTSKARIMPAEASGEDPVQDTSQWAEVDFNPQTLRLSFASIGNPGSQKGSAEEGTQGLRAQINGYSTSLSVELIFDDTTRQDGNVRTKTAKLANMVQSVDQNAPPTVIFQWGSFIFRGVIQSMEEVLDYFSDTGVPLRATVSLRLAGHKSALKQGDGAGGFSAGASAGFSAGASAGFSAGASAGFSAGAAVGTTPLTFAQSGESLQGLAGRAGVDWKAVASANNIDNPRLVTPGTVLDLNVRADVRVE
jgi:hypothetical protein